MPDTTATAARVRQMLEAASWEYLVDEDDPNTFTLDFQTSVRESLRVTVIVTEDAAPSGFAFGAVRFTPGSGDEATLVSAADGVIELDTSDDADGMVMLHVYNFAAAGHGSR